MPVLSQTQQKLFSAFVNCTTRTEAAPITLYRGAGVESLTPSFPNGHWYEKDLLKAKSYTTHGKFLGSKLKCIFVDTVISKHNLKLISLNQSMFLLNQKIYPDLFYSSTYLLHKALSQDVRTIFENTRFKGCDGIYMEKTGEYFIVEPAQCLSVVNTTIL